jgi:hypothetical protein
MTVTITRAQRDALYEEMLTDPTAVGDIHLELDNGDGEEARRLWRRFEAELRLLDELGWAAVEPCEQFAIDLPPALLVRALAHLQERSEHAVGEHLNAPDDSLEIAQQAVQVLAACRGAFEQLADQRAWSEWS